MLTMPPQRRQGDTQNESASIDAALIFDPANDKTRQEYAQETDVNYVLQRFGVTGHNEPPRWTDTDYTLDLQAALATIADAKQGHANLPDALRQKYPTWLSLLEAIDRGIVKPGDLDTPVIIPPPEPAAQP